MSILKHRIMTLRLREDAPFPSEELDAQEAIRNWRHEQLRRRLDSVVDSDVPDFSDPSAEGDE